MQLIIKFSLQDFIAALKPAKRPNVTIFTNAFPPKLFESRILLVTSLAV